MLAENRGKDRKPPIPPVVVPRAVWAPRRIFGRKARLQAREVKAAEEFKGRVWNMGLSLRSSQ